MSPMIDLFDMCCAAGAENPGDEVLAQRDNKAARDLDNSGFMRGSNDRHETHPQVQAARLMLAASQSLCVQAWWNTSSYLAGFSYSLTQTPNTDK